MSSRTVLPWAAVAIAVIAGSSGSDPRALELARLFEEGGEVLVLEIVLAVMVHY